MQDDAFARIQQLFDLARGLPEAEQRELLDREVGAEPDLRQAVERLLARDRDLEQRQRETLESLGPYRVLEVLGEGGMGTVYKAEQREPVRRLVALKVIRMGTETGEVLARFELERRALAAMSHECIAKVFDGGSTDRGQPYFAMEFVDGQPITRYCDEHGLSIEQRIRLFQRVCAGVQHAHQKGVIHRDLHPGNVLVAREGDAPIPKIVDFGLAKATNRDLLSRTIHTARNQLMGTLEYAAPEQMLATSDVIDTRADVYALGAILYELLTGELPLSRDELYREGDVGVPRVMREVDPMLPSTRLTTLAVDQRDSRAQSRASRTGSLAKELRGDLDWIVMKALAKEPERRYDSAHALAADLGRFLDHDPVMAGPPGAAYRLKKLARKYRVQLAAIAVGLFAWLIAGIVAIYFSVQNAELAREQTRLARIATESLAAKARDALAGQLQRLQRSAEHELWPISAELAPNLEAWLNEVRPLRESLTELRAELAALRSRGERRAEPAVRAGDDLAVLHERRRRLAGYAQELRTYIDDLERQRTAKTRVALARQEQTLRTIELERAEVEKALADYGYSFQDPSLAAEHAALARLVADLERFFDESDSNHVVGSVKRRLAAARALVARDSSDTLARWQASLEHFASSDDYAFARDAGYLLEPLPELAPLGVNAHGLLEFTHVLTGDEPSRGLAQGLGIDERHGVVFVLLPGGTFSMGSAGELAAPDERPVHDVTLAPFYCAKYELAQSVWLRLTGSNPSKMQPDPYGQDAANTITLTHPVELVSWNEAMTVLPRYGMTLPTEAQWEFAARAGSTTAFWWGDQAGREVALRAAVDRPHHAKIDSVRGNAFGLVHTLGNVWELCLDATFPYDRSTVREADGYRLPPNSTVPWDDRTRGRRGGSCYQSARVARSANRGAVLRNERREDTGLRPVIPLRR